MKLQAPTWLIAGLVLLGWLQPAFGVEDPLNDLISPDTARRIGLHVQWFTHVQVNPYRGEIAYMVHHVNDAKTTQVVEIHVGGQIESIAETDVDVFGKVMGIEGARQAANNRAEVLRAEGLQPEIKEVVLPEVTLYALTDQALVQALDGETGKTKWVSPVGSRHQPPQPFAANDEWVVIVNGMSVYFLDAETGRIEKEVKLSHAPGSGAAVTDTHAFVPLLGGMIEVFALAPDDKSVDRFLASGRNYIQPATANGTVSWGNDRAQLYVALTKRITSVAYHLSAGRDFLAPAVPFGDDFLVAASSDGYLRCVRAQTGEIIFGTSLGERILQSPFVIDEDIYAVTSIDRMYRVPFAQRTFDDMTEGIQQIVSASPTHLYCRGSANELLVVERKSGTIANRLATYQLDLWHTNQKTDRLFVGTKSGIIQCLREAGLEHPVLHGIPMEPADTTTTPADETELNEDDSSGE